MQGVEETSKKIDRNKWKILIITVMVIFMATLDSSIVNVALPVMAANLGVSTGTIAWVVSAYLIVIAATILLFGRLGDIRGRTNIFKIGLAVFTIGSLLCAVSNSLIFLIAARIIQAVGAAGVMANTQGIITETFPPEQRGRALGISGTFVALGTLTGPALGGLITHYSSWQYIFWINIPIGIVIFILGMKILPRHEKKLDEKMDLPGAILFILGIVPLFAALDQGQVIGFGNPWIIAALAVSVAALIAFFIIEKKSKCPLLDLMIFKNKWFSISILCGFLTFVAMFCSVIVQPFYLENVLKLDTASTGLFMTIYPLIVAVVAPASGYLSDRIGSEVLTLLGLALTSIGLFLLSTLTEARTLVVMGLFIAVMSLGNGLFQSPNNSLIMSTVPRDKLGIGGSVNALIRNLGMVCGILLANTLLYSLMSAKLGYLVNGYVEGRSDAFVYGMQIVYIVAAGICLIGAAITAVRLIQRRKEKKLRIEN